MQTSQLLRLAARVFARDNRSEHELDEELGFHLDMATEAHRRAGLSESAARRQALREFGGIEKTKEYMRDASGVRWLNDLLRDVRYAFRGLKRRPVFSFATIATVSVAVASTAIVAAATSQVLWKPLPNLESDRVVVLLETDGEIERESEGVSPGNLIEWQKRSSTFDVIGIAEPWSVDIDFDGRPRTLPSWQVSEEFVAALGLRPVLGRIFDPIEYEPAMPSAVMLSDGVWQRLFDRDPAIVGTELVLDGAAVRVVGVLPKEAGFPAARDFWLPRQMKPRDARRRTGGWMTAAARLKRGATYEAAQADLDRIAKALEDERPETNKNAGVRLRPLRDHLLQNVGPAVQALGVAAIVFFLAACATIASMFSTRLHAQAGELAMRGALGADQRLLLQQVFVEVFIICALGAIFGLLLAMVLIELLAATLPSGLPRL
ncbi:MAG: ABC transporter permease, partial [Pseudomonadales bacterium]